MAKEIQKVADIPEGVEVKVENGLVTVKGSKGEVSRNLKSPKIEIEVKDNQIQISTKKGTQREKKMIGTITAHTKNMMKGVSEGHNYKLKICSGHFPMTVTFKNNELSVKNFLGEKIPRIIKTNPDVTINVNGSDITVEGIEKEKTGQTAAAIEQLTRVTNKDRRIFQDGIYITIKDGKEL